MRYRHLISILLVIIFVVVNENANAQSDNFKKKRRSKAISPYRGGGTPQKTTNSDWSKFRPYYYGGVTVNTFNYFGDLAPVSKAASTDFSFTRPSFGLFYGF